MTQYDTTQTQQDASRDAVFSAPQGGRVGLTDFSSLDGANLLKRLIETYWEARGAAVMVAVENAGFHPAIRAARYEIRSDLINGLPRQTAKK